MFLDPDRVSDERQGWRKACDYGWCSVRYCYVKFIRRLCEHTLIITPDNYQTDVSRGKNTLLGAQEENTGFLYSQRFNIGYRSSLDVWWSSSDVNYEHLDAEIKGTASLFCLMFWSIVMLLLSETLSYVSNSLATKNLVIINKSWALWSVILYDLVTAGWY